MQRLYVAGPMSNIELYNYPAFEAAAGKLRAAGFEVLSPHEMTFPCGCGGGVHSCGVDHSWSDYMREALGLLLRAHGVAALEDWDRSRGARLEVMVARRLGMHVDLVDYWLGV